jgi:hypothetical protein
VSVLTILAAGEDLDDEAAAEGTLTGTDASAVAQTGGGAFYGNHICVFLFRKLDG